MEYITILYKMVGFLTPNPQCCLPSYDTLFIIKRGRLENSKLAMFDYRGGYYAIFHEDPHIFQHLPLICHCIPSTFYQYSSNCISFNLIHMSIHPTQYPRSIISHSSDIPLYSIFAGFYPYSIDIPLIFQKITILPPFLLVFSMVFSCFSHCWLHMSSTCHRQVAHPSSGHALGNRKARSSGTANSLTVGFFTVVITVGLGIASGVGR